MSNVPSRKTAGPALQSNLPMGHDNAFPQQHPDTQGPRELHDSLPNRSRNTTVDDSLKPNQDYMYQVPLPNRSLPSRATLGPTLSLSPHPGTVSHDPGDTFPLDMLAAVANLDQDPFLDFAPPIPGVNGNEVLYQSSTEKAWKGNFQFKKKNPFRDYSSHSRAHPSTGFQILAEIYDVEGIEIGLREYSHQLEDGSMCTIVRDVYGSHKIPGSGMPVSFSNHIPKFSPISTPTRIKISPSSLSRLPASKAAAAAITTSVPNLGSVDAPPIHPAAKKPLLNPLSTGLKFNSSKGSFEIFTNGTDALYSRPSPMLKTSADHGLDSFRANPASYHADNQPHTSASRIHPFNLFGRPRIEAVGVRSSRNQIEGLVAESSDGMSEDEVSTDETLSDDEDEDEDGLDGEGSE